MAIKNCVICGRPFDVRSAAKACGDAWCKAEWTAVRKARKRERMREYVRKYYSAPERKARRREYLREYSSAPERKARQREYQRKYERTPERKARKREYRRGYEMTPERKARDSRRSAISRKATALALKSLCDQLGLDAKALVQQVRGSMLDQSIQPTDQPPTRSVQG